MAGSQRRGQRPDHRPGRDAGPGGHAGAPGAARRSHAGASAGGLAGSEGAGDAGARAAWRMERPRPVEGRGPGVLGPGRAVAGLRGPHPGGSAGALPGGILARPRRAAGQAPDPVVRSATGAHRGDARQPRSADLRASGAGGLPDQGPDRRVAEIRRHLAPHPGQARAHLPGAGAVGPPGGERGHHQWVSHPVLQRPRRQYVRPRIGVPAHVRRCHGLLRRQRRGWPYG